jgi:sterol desaturase/sphingolipid hydroxylase (fatty acid hydroxylase superfamily)
VLLCLVLWDDNTFTENSFYSNVPSFAKTILILIVVDFVGYVMHRIYHSGSFWRFHSIHHSTKEISWISSVRFHPIEPITVLLAQYIISVILLGFGIEHVTYAILLRSYYGYMVHANLSWSFGKLGYIFASPYFHRWHHTMEKEGIDKNFGGVFSAWDFIFGTAYFPKHKQPHNFGVPDEVGKNIWQQFVYPFEKIWGKKSKML